MQLLYRQIHLNNMLFNMSIFNSISFLRQSEHQKGILLPHSWKYKLSWVAYMCVPCAVSNLHSQLWFLGKASESSSKSSTKILKLSQRPTLAYCSELTCMLIHLHVLSGFCHVTTTKFVPYLFLVMWLT